MLRRRKNQNKNRRAKRDLLQSAAANMQLPVGAMPDCAHFEMNSNREVIVEGCKAILQYDEDTVKINIGKMIASFYGRELSIKCLTADSLVIQGFIKSIEFIA